MRTIAALALALLLSAQSPAPTPPPQAAPVDFAARLHLQGVTALAAGNVDEARNAWTRALERDPRRLETLAALSKLERDVAAAAQGAAGAHATDAALEHATRFLEVWEHLRERPTALSGEQRALATWARQADPLRKRLDTWRRGHVGKLLALAGEQMDAGAWHAARALLAEARASDPEHPDLAAGEARIQKDAGDELAVADEGGGADPLAGVTAEWIEKHDREHEDWDKAWTLDTEHYRVRTNAGYRVLRTVAHAMEQVQIFYRVFHQHQADGGKIPVADVHVFKNAAEYKELGAQPVEWAGGHWDGQKVVTYDPRSDREQALAGLLGTLFHEASHQFTSLAGGSAVPSWLNEGMASFFEGTTLLSNGGLEWNQVVPGRLYPLVEDLRGAEPKRLADVIAGRVDDYRVYYPFGWGIVYHLWNADDADGTLLYRPLMREYFQEYHQEDHVERFTEFFVTRAAAPGIATLDQFESSWKQWIFALEAEDQGRADAARRDAERGARQLARGDVARAIELLERSLAREPDHPDTLWSLFEALEKSGAKDRALGTLRRWLAVTAVDADSAGEAPTVDPYARRRAAAEAALARLDEHAKKLAELRRRHESEALALAEEYQGLGFPRLALRVLRGPATAAPPSAQARARYFAIADASGVTMERWRLVFDEQTLRGFYGGGEGDFRVVDGAIESAIGVGFEGAPATGEATPAVAADNTFAFRRLFIDLEPAGDWSLEAEIEVARGGTPAGRGTLAGLCFGKKGDGVFHGVALLASGHLDLASVGTDATTMLRTKVEAKSGWRKLRIEVAGTRLVAHLDGAQVLEWEFQSRAALRGDFGLLAGAGRARFREIRLLEFDPGLPRRTKIGRRRDASAPAAEADAPLERAAPGQASYLNQVPPELAGASWIGDPPGGGTLEGMRHWPCVLVFWTTYQERALPLLPGLAKLAETHAALGIPIVLVSNEKREVLDAWLAEHPAPFPIAYEPTQALYAAYAIPTVQLPHAKIVGSDGRVAWEGNPDWKAEFGSYLEAPLAALVEREKLAELKTAAAALAAARQAEERGALAEAAQGYRAIAALGVSHPTVVAARDALATLEARGAGEVAAAATLAGSGRVLQATRTLARASTTYEGLDAAAAARAALATLEKSAGYRRARPLETWLKQAEGSLASGKRDAARATLETTLAKCVEGTDPELRERAEWLRAACGETGAPAEALRRYRERFGL